jgi:NADH:ubiquinone oxidoreductase subunit E
MTDHRRLVICYWDNPGANMSFDLEAHRPELDALMVRENARGGALIPVLHQAQEIYGYLPRELQDYIAEGLGVPQSTVYGVVTFYAQFWLTRRGRHLIRLCDGTACHVRGSDKVIETLEDAIGLQAGATSPDYKYTLEIVYCLGSCGLAPVAVVDDKVHGRLTPDALVAQIATLR